ncbi:hypothetical protein E2C01_007843 [Portunus trituberculatus]|uniref:Uncharacterized protein n=1 Tax=Portunus trituberculatus TaxID=210409 RepID=A0A5B7D026_PORTR|nr:hypothetical protein [Portunus trituberculatus]
MTRLSAWTWLVVGGLAVLAAHAHAAGPKADVIEDVNAKQLEDLVADSDYVAVFWWRAAVAAGGGVAGVRRVGGTGGSGSEGMAKKEGGLSGVASVHRLLNSPESVLRYGRVSNRARKRARRMVTRKRGRRGEVHTAGG